MGKEKVFNLPNLLSAYRLLTFPFLLWIIYSNSEKLFALFLCINLVTDILDGLIARLFKLQTQLGARLDSLADLGTYILAFLGIYTFKLHELAHELWLVWIFLPLFLSYYIASLIKFKKMPHLHLYSAKIGGYLQGIFFFVLFAFGYYPWLFYTALVWGCLSALEEVTVILLLKEMKADAKGLFWVVRGK